MTNHKFEAQIVQRFKEIERLAVRMAATRPNCSLPGRDALLDRHLDELNGYLSHLGLVIVSAQRRKKWNQPLPYYRPAQSWQKFKRSRTRALNAMRGIVQEVIAARPIGFTWTTPRARNLFLTQLSYVNRWMCRLRLCIACESLESVISEDAPVEVNL